MRSVLRIAATIGGFTLAMFAFAEPEELRLEAGKLTAWEFVSPEPTPIEVVLQAHSDGVLAVPGKPMGYLQTRATFADFDLHVEWRWLEKPGNGGILLHIDSGPIDRGIWPRCLQVQTKHTRVGDLLPMAGAQFIEPLTTPPDARTPQLDRRSASNEKPAGEWNSCDVRCRASVVEISINGLLQNRVTGCVPAAGRIGFQFEGVAYELRAVRITPVKP